MNEQADFESAAAASCSPPPFEALAQRIGNRRDWEDRLIGSITDNPLESLLGLLLGGSVLFRLFALHHPSSVGACGMRWQRHRFGPDGLPHAGAFRRSPRKRLFHAFRQAPFRHIVVAE